MMFSNLRLYRCLKKTSFHGMGQCYCNFQNVSTNVRLLTHVSQVNEVFDEKHKITQLNFKKDKESYLESMFNYNKNDWIPLLKECTNKEDLLLLLTGFQRYIRHLSHSQLLFLMETCNKFDVQINNSGIDVYHVLLCEMVYKLMYKNIRGLSMLEISKLSKILIKVKFTPNIRHDLNENSILVPICEGNFNGILATCNGCKSRYGDLLIQNGSDMIMLLMTFLGKSLYIQSYGKRKLHENDIIPYLSLVASKNCTTCSCIVKKLIIRYYKQFINSNSIHNIAILLHTIKRCKVRLFNVFSNTINRLLENNKIEFLSNNESSPVARMVAISQVILSSISASYRPTKYNHNIDSLLYKLLVYILSHHRPWINYTNQWSKFVTQLNVLYKSCQVERHNLYKAFTNDGNIVSFFDSIQGHVPNFDDISTSSNTHLQVSNALRSLYFDDIQCETYMNPYLIDLYIPSRRLVIEVDGPYHYIQNINQRTNKILKRDVEYYAFRYTLNSRLKQRLLSKSSYTVVNIPFYSWPCNNHEQTQYLISLL